MGEYSMARKVYDVFKKNLTDRKFNFTPKDDELVIILTVHGEDLPQPTVIRVLAERDVVQVLSPIPSRMPEDKRADAAIAVAVANYGMINGSFDLDMSDGEIRFRATQGFQGMDEFPAELANYLLQVVFFTTDKYNDRFFMLGKGMMSLADFIAKEKA